MLRSNEALIRAGGAVVELRPRDKRPKAYNWTSLPKLSWKEANERFSHNSNIGIRLGEPSRLSSGRYILVIDLDIRGARYTGEAYEALRALVGDTECFDVVMSGSGGASRHFYFTSDRPFRSRKLAHSKEKLKGPDGKPHWAWEIELFGTGKQVAIPPSIHPVSRKPYKWLTDVQWDDLRHVPADEVASWMPGEPAPKTGVELDDEMDELASWYHKQPARFSIGEIEDILDRLASSPSSFGAWVTDRDGWFRVGMAIHHQLEGSEAGYEMWCAFSAQDDDKFDEENQREIWESFGKNKTLKPLTMKTLLLEAQRVDHDVEYGLSAASYEPVDSRPDDFGVGKVLARKATNRLDSVLGEEPGAEFEEDSEPPPLDDRDEALLQLHREMRREEDRAADAWRMELELSDQDKIKASDHNIVLIVQNDPRIKGVICQNDFTQQITYRQQFRFKTPTTFPVPLDSPASGDLWTDKHDVNLANFLSTPPRGREGGYGLKATNIILNRAVISAAQKNRFHPVREYLKSVRWDGESRMDSVFCRYLGSPDRPYFREVSRLMFLAAVVRVFEPGHKWDFAVIFEGLEGKGKSSFIRAMAAKDDWFGEMQGDFHDRKAMVEKMMGKWILELPELSGMVKSESTDVKACISAQEDYVRLAYAHRACNFKRQSIFVGSTNDIAYLMSETGNRRFFPVHCEVRDIDLVEFRKEVPQLWAEAYAGYREMRRKQKYGTLPLYLTDKSAADEAFAAQAERKVESNVDILFGQIESWLSTPATIADITGDMANALEGNKPEYVRTRVCTASVWKEMLNNTAKGPTTQDTKDISLALARLNWVRRKERHKPHGQQHWHIKPKTTARDLSFGYKKL